MFSPAREISPGAFDSPDVFAEAARRHLHCEGPMMPADACRPVPADLLEVKRGVARISLQMSANLALELGVPDGPVILGEPAAELSKLLRRKGLHLVLERSRVLLLPERSWETEQRSAG